jgi:drug/metabolite transporter (DMT)-like permease
MTPTSKSRYYLGVVFALIATLIWSGNFLIARGQANHIPPIGLAFWRWTVALLVILPAIIPNFLKHIRLITRYIKYFSITSFFGVTVFNTLIYFGGQTSSAINLSLIAISAPIFIIILSRIIDKERFTTLRILGVLVTILGVLTLISRGSLNNLLNITFVIGDLWMLMAAFSFASYNIMVRRKPLEVETTTFLFGTFLVGLIFLTPFYIIEHFTVGVVPFDFWSIMSYGYLGIFSSLIAYIFWTRAVGMIGPSNAGTIYYALPVFSAVVAIVVLKERATFVHLISMTIIISGLLLAQRAQTLKT